MSMTSLLFSPTGRIGPAAFWRGFVIVLGAGIVLQIAQRLFIEPAVASGQTSAAVGALSFILIGIFIASWWATICVIVKRLHDSGKSGWMAIPAGLGWGLAFLIAALVCLLAFGGSEFAEYMRQREADPSLMQTSDFHSNFQTAIQRKLWLPLSLASFAISVGLGFVLARLQSDPHPNDYGPATQSRDADFT